MASVAKCVEIELNIAAGFKVFEEVVEEVSPFFTPPMGVIGTAIKASHVTRDEIEFLAEIRQWLEGFDAPDDARELEQFEGFAEDWLRIDVHADHIVTEAFKNVQEIAGAGADVEDAEFRRCLTDAVVAHTLHIGAHPIIEIEILLRVDLFFRIIITGANFFKAILVDGVNERLRRQRIGKASQHGFGALPGIEVEDFFDFMGEAHVRGFL